MVLSLDDIQIGWICALATEASVARLMLDHVYHETIPLPKHDDNIYTYGRVNLKTGDGFHNIAIAQLPLAETGKASAATVAKDMRRTFPNLKFGLMVGIAGGVWTRKTDVRLGDIVVGVAEDNGPGVIQYDHGKYIQDSDFVPRGVMDKAPKPLRTAVGIIQRNHMCGVRDYVASLDKQAIVDFAPRPARDRLFEASYTHRNTGRSCRGCDKDQLCRRSRRPFTHPAVHYGPIASGDAVIKDALLARDIHATHGVLCFEMEAAGLDAAFPCLVVRGISDYADTHKNDDWHRYAAAAAAAYAKEVLAVVTPTAVSALPSIGNQYWIIPRRSSSLFTGRVAVLSKLNKQLLPDPNVKIQPSRQISVLQGMGGSGKSEVAIRFAEANRDKFWAVFWVDANTKTTAEQSFARIAHVCGLKDTDVNSVRHWLANVGRSWLLILDNCDDNKIDYAQYFPPSQRGSIIFTTRLVEYQKLGKPQNLDILDRKDAVALILKACGLKPVSWERQKFYAEEVVTLLQQLVLALVLAGSYINKGYCTLEQYPDVFKRQPRRMMHEKFDQSYGDVYSTFEVTAAALQGSGTREDRLALGLLGVLSFFHHEDIQEAIFVRALESCKSVEHDMQQEYEQDDRTERNTPRWKSRLQRFARGRSYTQSRTLKLISYSKMIEGEIDQLGWQVIRAREAYLPQDDPDVLDAKYQVASVYVRHDRHLEAIPILKRLIKVMSRCLEPHNHLLLSAQHYLGLAYNYAGEYDKAIAVLSPLAVVHTSALDRKHKDRLVTMNVLACAYHDYGRSEKAIEIWEEIASLELELPANAEPVGDILRLATAYTDTGDTENATRVLEQWLSVRRKDGPLDDEETRYYVRLLGELYHEFGRHEDAIKLLQELVDLPDLQPVTKSQFSADCGRMC
ncbi:purine and uridine phosphorylase, partial [Aureobasidium melanogenum]